MFFGHREPHARKSNSPSAYCVHQQQNPQKITVGRTPSEKIADDNNLRLAIIHAQRRSSRKIYAGANYKEEFF
jgi:hypothetical protein